MDHENESRRTVSRRGVLKALALAAGAVVAPGLPAVAAAMQPGGRESGSGLDGRLRVGVLVPETLVYPLLATNYLAGMQLFGGGTRDPATALSVTSYKLNNVVAQAEQLLAGGSQTVVGVLGGPAVARLRPLFEQQRVPLIVTGSGANIPRPGETGPFIAYHTLNGWQSAWAIGYWLARQVGRRAFVAASAYDSGFDAAYTFQLGYEAGGGEVVDTYFSHIGGQHNDWAAMAQAIRRAQPDVVYGNYSGSAAREFVEAYSAAGLDLPLAGSMFCVADDQLAAYGDRAIGIKSASPWSAVLAAPEAQQFAQRFQGLTSRPADAFAAQGYTTAGLLAAAVGVSGDPARSTGSWIEALRSVEFSGPYGQASLRGRGCGSCAPIYLHEVRADAAGVTNAVISALDGVDEADARVQQLLAAPKTGWVYSHLSM